jgi:peptide/nickel transport system permease protein
MADPAHAEPTPPAGPTPVAEAGDLAAPDTRPRWREIFDILVGNRLALFGLIVLGSLVLAAVFGPALVPYGLNEINVQDRLIGPSAAHWFGTDELGRDVFTRVVLAARVSLLVGLVAVGISLSVGVVFGLIAGFYGGRLEDVIMRLMDVIFAFPAVLLAIAILAILGPGTTSTMVAIGIVYTPIFARIVRGSALSVREEVYVRAARAVGANDLRLVGLHVLPNLLAPVIVQTSISLAFAILSEAALSFLGLGVQPPDPSWGRMLFEGRGFIQQAWWIAVFPGLAIFLTVLSFNVVGDALRDALDPRQRSAIQSQGLTA